ncbi:MAG: histidine phosphatase family protein [Opitutaceae bacterium]
MAVQVWLVRHGETEWAASRRHTSRTDVPLTPHGETSARQLGPLLQKIAPRHVLSSPRQRALRTCELAGLGDGAEVDAELREWDYGDYEGLTSAEIRRHAPSWNLFLDGCPLGESPEQMVQRADRVVVRLDQTEGSVMIFSHGHFLRSLAARWIRRPVTDAQNFALATASVSLLAYEHPDRATPTLSLWNASSETLGTAFAPPASL